MNFSLTSIAKANAQGSEFIEESGIRFLFEEWNKVLGGISQLTEALKSHAYLPNRLGNVWSLDSREGQSSQKMCHSLLFYKMVYSNLQHLAGEQIGGFCLRCGTSRLLDDQLVIE